VIGGILIDFRHVARRGRAYTSWRAVCCAAILCNLVPAVAFGVMPQDPEAVYAAAFLRGDYAEALATLEGDAGTNAQNLPLAWAVDRAELLNILGRGEEALLAMREIVQSMQEPHYTVRMAEMLQELGRKSDADQALQWAMQQNQVYYQRQRLPRENLLAMGRAVRMRGENPNRVLQIYQQRLLSREPDFVPAYLEAGALALSSYAYDLAEEYFLGALAIEVDHQDAMAGLAETYWKAGDPRFEEVRDRLEALNAHHPHMQGLVVARALAADDTEGAEAVLDDLLGTNPQHRLGLAYRAAVAFLKDDPEAQQDALDKLATLDPERADGYLIVGETAARRYRFDDAVAILREGLALEPGSVALEGALGLNLLRTGADSAGREILERAFEKDRFNVQLYNMLEVLDTIDGFATLRPPGFEIRLPEAEAEVMGREMVELLSEALKRYQREYEVEIDGPLHAQLFDEHDEFMVRSVGLPGNAGHLGICFGRLITLDSPRARPPRSMNWRSVLWHEFVHVITLQKTNNRIPRWLSEGISVFEETQRDASWGQPLQPEFAALVEGKSWPTVGELEHFFVRPESPSHLMLGYYFAGQFVDAYVGSFGMDSLLKALVDIGDGANAEAALAEASGVALRALDEQFSAHLDTACKPLRYLHREPSPTFLKSKVEKPSFFREMEGAEKALEDGDMGLTRKRLARAAELFPDFPGPDNPLRHLTRIHRESGDLDAWSDALIRLQCHDLTAYDEPYAYMEAASERGDWPAVVRQAEWCAGIDPFDVTLYTFRQRAQEALGQREELVKTLEILAALDPTQEEIHQLASARNLVHLGRSEESRRTVLEVLERFPEYRAAQLLLMELQEAPAEGEPDDS
jgi:tetratricopeptide (TPR) repeat protein